MIDLTIFKILLLLSRLAFYTMDDDPEADYYFDYYDTGFINIIEQDEIVGQFSFEIEDDGDTIIFSDDIEDEDFTIYLVDNGLYEIDELEEEVDMAYIYSQLPWDDFADEPDTIFEIEDIDGFDWEGLVDWEEDSIYLSIGSLEASVEFEE